MLTHIKTHKSRQRERDYPLKIWVLMIRNVFDSAICHVDIHLLTFNGN